MKNFKILILFTLGLVVSACSVDDPLTVVTQDTVARGAVLRTIQNDPSSFSFSDPESVWSITWEEQDHEDGDLLSSVDLMVSFVDLTPANGTIPSQEAALTSIPASAFAKGVNGLPRTDYSVSYNEVLSSLGLPFVTDYAGDAINIRVILNLTDGRSITNTDLTGNVSGGSFFSSPLNYRSNIVCPDKSGTPGTWTINMQDSYGDGWNGASVQVTLDGEVSNYLITGAQGAANSETFEVSPDSEVMSIIYISGDWDSEVTYQVISASGATIIDDGPSPVIGAELLDYCSDF